MVDKVQFLTAIEASKYLRVTRESIYRWVNSGKLPAMRAGRQWRFRKAELDKWLRKQGKVNR